MNLGWRLVGVNESLLETFWESWLDTRLDT